MVKNILSCDVLVIGAGGAGLRVAIEAHDSNVKVIVVGKALEGKSHTVMAEGGINAALGNLDKEDSWQIHAQDTLRGGQFINNPDMVEIFAKESPDAILELEKYGAIFDRTPDGNIMQRPFGGHTYRRSCHIADRSGLEIINVLVSELKRRSIEHLEEVFVTKIFTKDNVVLGASGISLMTGEHLVFNSKAVVIATGGYGKVYKRTSNPWESMGDGVAMALDAGAELMDMEMVQFHPTGVVTPKSIEGVLVTEAVRGEGGRLYNSLNERFMEKYDKEGMELGCRDVVARAIYQEVKEGKGTEHGGVWLDITHKSPRFIRKKLPKMVKLFKDFGNIDITKERMEVAPTTHYTMGGIGVDMRTSTAVKGLYAVGEAMGGVHGANRLGCNSLTDLIIFGKIGGKRAAEYSKNVKLGTISESEIKGEWSRLNKPFEVDEGIKPSELKRQIQELMWDKVSILRNGTGLKKALNELNEIRKKSRDIKVNGNLKYNPSWMDYIDVLNMLPICESVIQSAITRKESRGAHFRIDYPDKDDKNWLVNVVVSRDRKDGIDIKRQQVNKDKLIELGGYDG